MKIYTLILSLFTSLTLSFNACGMESPTPLSEPEVSSWVTLDRLLAKRIQTVGKQLSMDPALLEHNNDNNRPRQQSIFSIRACLHGLLPCIK